MYKKAANRYESDTWMGDLPAFKLKRCSACREIKFLVDFVRNRSASTGYGNYCKLCHNVISRRNRERLHGSSRNYLLRHRYGVDPEHIDSVLAQQKGLCAVCRRLKARHVDHDHSGGAVRGILCFSCNGALGQFNDDPERLASAIRYLADAAQLMKIIGTPGAEQLTLCVVCRVRLPVEQFQDDWRRHRRRKQWCRACGDELGRAAIDVLSRSTRRYHLLTKYGIDAHEVEELVADQGGVCAICQTHPAEQVDHDHKTGFVRGVLCGGCNAGLGQLKECPDIIRSGIDYLERWRGNGGAVQETAVPYILSVA